MPLTHIVMFEFKPETDAATIQEVCKRMLDLQKNCVRPSTQKPYIKTISGGKNNSKEPTRASFSYGFVVEFEAEGDRDYYTKEDPAHRAFVESLHGLLKGLGVFDFVPGDF